eukprot:176333_1
MQRPKQCTPVITVNKSNFETSTILHPIVQHHANYPDNDDGIDPSPYTNILGINIHYIKHKTLYPLQHDIFNNLAQTQGYQYQKEFQWTQATFQSLIDTLTCSSYYAVGFCFSSDGITSPPQHDYPYYLVIYKGPINSRVTDEVTGKQTNTKIGEKINKRIYCANNIDSNTVLHLCRFGYDLSKDVIKCGFALGDWSYCYRYQPQFALINNREGLEYKYCNDDGNQVILSNRCMKEYDAFIDYDPVSKPIKSFDKKYLDPLDGSKMLVGAKLRVGFFEESYLQHLADNIRDLITIASRDAPPNGVIGVCHSNPVRDKLMMGYEYIWEKTENIPK